MAPCRCTTLSPVTSLLLLNLGGCLRTGGCSALKPWGATTAVRQDITLERSVWASFCVECMQIAPQSDRYGVQCVKASPIRTAPAVPAPAAKSRVRKKANDARVKGASARPALRKVPSYLLPLLWAAPRADLSPPERSKFWIWPTDSSQDKSRFHS